MQVNMIITIILSSAAIILLILSIIFYGKEQSRKYNCTEKTNGTVRSYSVNTTRAPVVEYIVNNKSYNQSLKYSFVRHLSTPFSSPHSISKDDLMNTKLRIRSNSIVSLNTLMFDNFPIGFTLNVYYNPENPKESYVERYAPEYLWTVLLGTAVFMIIINVLIVWLSGGKL